MARLFQPYAQCRSCGVKFENATWLPLDGDWLIVAAALDANGHPVRERGKPNKKTGRSKLDKVVAQPVNVLHNRSGCERRGATAQPVPTQAKLSTPTTTQPNKETPTMPTRAQATTAPSLDGILGAFVEASTASLSSRIDKLEADIEAKAGREPVSIQIGNAPAIQFDPTDHRLLPKVAALLHVARTTHVWPYLWGPPGTGKSFAPSSLGDKMNLMVVRVTLGPATLPSSIFGYQNASGHYVETPFYLAWRDGRCILVIEEMDNSNPAILTLLNGALANNVCTFPCGDVPRNEECLIVANGNTPLRGGTKGHESRQKLDAASLDRFAFVHFPTDVDQEKARVKSVMNGSTEDLMAWVIAVRDHIVRHRPDIVSSQRGTVGIAHAIHSIPRSVMSDEDILETYLFRGIDANVRDSVLDACPVPKSIFSERAK